MVRPAQALFVLAFALCGGPNEAGAAESSGDCILDNCRDQAPSDEAAQDWRAQSRSAKAPGDFDFYVLALSWSSGFCRINEFARGRSQCAAGAHLGFVVHGLWPQYEHGYPSDCGPAAREPSRIALEGAAGLYPDEGLARHEWRKHGACSGKSPTDYFADVRKARGAVVIPTPFKDPTQDQTWTPIDIERAFIAANRRLRPGMIGVACTKGVLQEVRICFSKDLRDFHACPEISRRGCRAREISAPGEL